MRLSISSDWHLTDTTPRCRKDNYTEEQFKKVKFIVDKSKCDVILHGGDLTDSPNIPYKITSRYIDLLSGKTPIYTVFGQHDLRNHTHKTKNNTALHCMKSAGALYTLDDEVVKFKRVTLYGAGYNQPMPIPDSDSFNVLIIHRLVSTRDEWGGGAIWWNAEKLLKEYDFDLIVTGDNHTQFVTSLAVKGKYRTLVNPGSLMRSKINQGDHKPAFFIYDTVTRRLSRHQIPITPWDEVKTEMQINEGIIQDNEQRIEQLMNFLMQSSSTNVSGLDFTKNLQQILEIENPQPEMLRLVDDVFESIQRSRPHATNQH